MVQQPSNIAPAEYEAGSNVKQRADEVVAHVYATVTDQREGLQAGGAYQEGR